MALPSVVKEMEYGAKLCKYLKLKNITFYRFLIYIKQNKLLLNKLENKYILKKIIKIKVNVNEKS